MQKHYTIFLNLTALEYAPPLNGYALPISPKKPMKSMLLAKSHIAVFVDDFGLVGNAQGKEDPSKERHQNFRDARN